MRVVRCVTFDVQAEKKKPNSYLHTPTPTCFLTHVYKIYVLARRGNVILKTEYKTPKTRGSLNLNKNILQKNKNKKKH